MPEEQPPPRHRISRRTTWALGTLVVVAVAAGLGAGATVLGQHLIATPQELPHAAGATPSATPPSPSPVPAPQRTRFVEFRDPQAGVALSYPAGWTRLQPTDPEVALLAASDRGASLLVRVAPRDTTGSGQVPPADQLTEKVASSNDSVHLVTEPKRIRLGGLPGYFYFYTFTDPISGATGAHSHFFLFGQDRMVVLVFQALPARHFQDAAATFDRITASFRVLGD